MRPWMILGLCMLAPPALGDIRNMESCLALIETDAATAREQAAQWRVLGGGAPARTCEAFAMAATGAKATAAEQLTELAQDPNAGLGAEVRAFLLSEAGILWEDQGQHRLSLLTHAAAVRLNPTPLREIAVARAHMALEDWPAVVETLSEMNERSRTADRMLARAEIALGKLDTAAARLAGLPDSPYVALERARLQVAQGDPAAARDTLAAISAEEPGLKAEIAEVLATLVGGQPAAAQEPVSASAAPDVLPEVPRETTATVQEVAAEPTSEAATLSAPRPMPRRP